MSDDGEACDQLRQIREGLDLSVPRVAVAMEWSPNKLRRIERGEITISTNDLRALLRFYKVDPERVEQLIDAARDIRTRKLSRTLTRRK